MKELFRKGVLILMVRWLFEKKLTPIEILECDNDGKSVIWDIKMQTSGEWKMVKNRSYNHTWELGVQGI